MADPFILDVKAGLEEENEGYARQVRAFLKEKDVRCINLMASPGAGKTTLLCRIIDTLKDSYEIYILEADVDADVDARAVMEHGARAVQLHTGGSCHMDGRMMPISCMVYSGIHSVGSFLPKRILPARLMA